jgi:hypothetical protein
MIILALPALAQQVQQVNWTATLNPQMGQTARGTATATMRGDQLTVTLRMSGLTPNATHVTHVHEGQCPSVGAILVPLTDLRTDATGNATSTSTITVPPGTPPPTPGTQVVHVHAGPALPSPSISCGNVVLAAAAFPRTGAGPASAGRALPAALAVALATVGGAGCWLRRRRRE